MNTLRASASSAELYSFVHENEMTGCPLGLYWNLSIDLLIESISHAPQSLACEWLTFSASDWRALEGVTEKDIISPATVESTVYTGWHQWASLKTLRFGRRSGAEFEVELQLSLDLELPDGGVEKDLSIHAATMLKYIGAIVVPGNLSPKPSSIDLAATVLGQFADLGSFDAAIDERFRYRFPPFVSG